MKNIFLIIALSIFLSSTQLFAFRSVGGPPAWLPLPAAPVAVNPFAAVLTGDLLALQQYINGLAVGEEPATDPNGYSLLYYAVASSPAFNTAMGYPLLPQLHPIMQSQIIALLALHFPQMLTQAVEEETPLVTAAAGGAIGVFNWYQAHHPGLIVAAGLGPLQAAFTINQAQIVLFYILNYPDLFHQLVFFLNF